MAFLVIEGTTINAVVGTWGEDPPETMGRLRRRFSGRLSSTQRTAKRTYSGQADFFTAADLDLMLGFLSTGDEPFGTIPKPVVVTSDADGLTRGATITAYVIAGKREPNVQIVAGVETTWWTVPLTIRER